MTKIIESDRVLVAVLANGMNIIAVIGHDNKWHDPAIPQFERTNGEGGPQIDINFRPLMMFTNENSITAPKEGDSIATVAVGTADEDIRRVYLNWRKALSAARAGISLPRRLLPQNPILC